MFKKTSESPTDNNNNTAANVNGFLKDFCEKTIESELTDGQKVLLVYHLHEALLREFLSSGNTLSAMREKYGDEKQNTMQSLTRKQYMAIMNYKKKLEKLINPVSDYLYNFFMDSRLSEDYSLEVESHYKSKERWSGDIRSNIIRRLQKTCRGFGFQKGNENRDI